MNTFQVLEVKHRSRETFELYDKLRPSRRVAAVAVSQLHDHLVLTFLVTSPRLKPNLAFNPLPNAFFKYNWQRFQHLTP